MSKKTASKPSRSPRMYPFRVTLSRIFASSVLRCRQGYHRCGGISPGASLFCNRKSQRVSRLSTPGRPAR
ncbi:hypothetical protein IG631_23613 [Alternaria alternata]|nr:hypothetical protein IG631_23613 [Alternaria alternata]